MDDDSMQDLEIFLNAPKDASPGELDAYLDEYCGADSELRRRVEALIAAEGSAGEFMCGVAADGAEDAAGEWFELEKPGEMIGRYRLLEKIGEGGFGSVWLAEQTEPISRRVALKVVKAGMDTRQVLARFEGERQALAMMQHPNIARVLDAGATANGRPYFVMELVEGVPITRFCDEQDYGPRQRLELFRDVCSAVNHAHQKGVIHRDLKPSNVMVSQISDNPVAKVIDFGISKATEQEQVERTMVTRLGQFLGTPAYMSPEQAALGGIDIDTRSDIYSLGVLLYELMAGAPPFDPDTLLSAGFDEMRRIIREEAPPKPSMRYRTSATAEVRLNISESALKGDLDWIVMKAIEKERSRRYETANALAADIDRHLADEPVLAGAPSPLYRFRKFARRNKLALAMVAIVAGVLVAATVVSLSHAARATAAERVASERLSESDDLSRFLIELIDSPTPERDGRTVTVVELFDRAAEKLSQDLAAHPGSAARFRSVLATSYNRLGLFAPAVPLQEAALDYYLESLGEEHPTTLHAMFNLAVSLHRVGRRDESRVLRLDVLRLRRKVLGPEHPGTILAMSHLANIHASLGEFDKALALREEAYPLSKKVNGSAHPDTLFAMGNLAISYAQAGRSEEAHEMREQVYKISLEALGPKDSGTLRAMTNLAGSYGRSGQTKTAIELLEQIIAIQTELYGARNAVTFRSQTFLAGFFVDDSRLEEAEDLLESVLAGQREILGAKHKYTLQTARDLARCHSFGKRFEEARRLLEETLPPTREVNGESHPDTLEVMKSLADTYEKLGLSAEAAELRQELSEQAGARR